MTCPRCPRPPGRLSRWLRRLWARLRGHRPIRVVVWRPCRECKEMVVYELWV